MIVSTDVVLRYCPALDRFIKVRVFTDAEAVRLLANCRVARRRDYTRYVLSLCLPEYAAGLLLDELLIAGKGVEDAELALYQVCVDLNPHLEISQVTLPVSGQESRDEVYLVDVAPGQREEQKPVRYLELEELLGRSVVGQPEAVARLSRVVRRSAAGLRDPNRPVGSFFFLGQTGVGKTELAKALTRVLFGCPEHLVRIDCSEYSQPHEYAKLIGAPTGYIGHNEGGYLTDPLRARPECVVLFDEIEKAHPKVHQLLLQLLDEGVLTDSKGRKASFREAIVILTSNVGSFEADELDRRVGFGNGVRVEEVEGTCMAALRRAFAPEFVNRIDEVVVFRPLGPGELLQICDLLLAEVSHYLEPKGLKIEFDAEVKDYLAEAGSDPKYGARPLRRAIQRRVLDPLADRLLDGSLQLARHIRTHLEGTSISFEAA